MVLEGLYLLSTVTVIDSLGFMMVGFDNGLMGGFVDGVQWRDTFDNPSATMVGLIVAIFEVGCFFGSLFSSVAGEALGRRKSIALSAVTMILGATIQAASYSRAQLMVGRIVSGLGMGLSQPSTAVFQAEYSPKGIRGMFVCMQISTLNFGAMLVYWINFGMQDVQGSIAWRIPTILQCFFLLTQLVLLLFVPDTARWYAQHDRPDDSLMVLKRLYKGRETEEEIIRIHRDIMENIAMEKALGSGSWRDVFKDDSISTRRRLMLACGIQIMEQLGGNNAVNYYANTLFENIGFQSRNAGMMAGFLNTWFFVGSFIPYALIDTWGRRPLLIYSISLMGTVMAILAALIYQVQHKTAIAHQAGIGAAAMLFMYVGGFTIGFQATVWVYPPEIMPLRFRQLGTALSSASNWIFNFVVVMITPPAIQNVGWRTYIIFAVFNAAWVPIFYFFYPETKGLQLEDVDRMFSKEEALETMAAIEEKDRMSATDFVESEVAV